eukprot:COSAG01_NODE_173_length_23099_cov_37.564783_3_plen_121_part_00
MGQNGFGNPVFGAEWVHFVKFSLGHLGSHFYMGLRTIAARALSAESPQQSAVVAYSRDFGLRPGQAVNRVPAGQCQQCQQSSSMSSMQRCGFSDYRRQRAAWGRSRRRPRHFNRTAHASV